MIRNDELSSPQTSLTSMSTRQLRDQIDILDDAILKLWRQRAEVSHTIGDRRMADGGPRIVLNRENEVIARYRTALGDDGVHLAMLALRAGRGPLGSADCGARKEKINGSSKHGG
jgi:chorismate mutase